MQYISADEFLKQPKEVQEVFLNWWKPQMYDLFFRNFGNNSNFFLNGIYISCIQDGETLYNVTKDKSFLPLLTEGQLREFIEDETSGRIENELDFEKVSEIFKKGKFKYIESKDSPSYSLDPKIIGEYSRDLKSQGYTFRGIGSYGETICQMYQKDKDIIFLEFETEEGWLSYLNVLRQVKAKKNNKLDCKLAEFLTSEELREVKK